MQAIILAAGMGRRLGELTRYDTKCMIEVNGIRIIDRLLANLAVARLSRIVLVIGFQGDKLRAYLGNEYCGIPIYYLENPYYAYTNNIYSLFLARHHLASDDTLLLESDIVFEKRILERVLEEPYPDVAVVDRYKSWMDGTMVTVDEKQFIVDFVSKHTFSYEKTPTYFKTVNIYRFSKEFSVGKYVPFLEAYCKCFDNSAYYEQILAVLSLLDKAGLKALPLEGEKWYEELLMDEEGLQKTVNDRIFIGKPIDMDYDRFERALQRLGEAALSETADVRELVHDLVPEYHYKNMDSDIAAAEAAASRDFEVTPVNPERFAVHKKIAMYNLGVK